MRQSLLLLLLPMLLCGWQGLAFCSGRALYLQLVDPLRGEVLLEYQVRPGERFAIDYTHSSDHTPVHDEFRIAPSGELVLVRETYAWYGSGLEFHPGADAAIRQQDGQTTVELERAMERLRLRVGRVAGHIFSFRGHRTPLLDLAPGGDPILIRAIDKGAERP